MKLHLAPTMEQEECSVCSDVMKLSRVLQYSREQNTEEKKKQLFPCPSPFQTLLLTQMQRVLIIAHHFSIDGKTLSITLRDTINIMLKHLGPFGALPREKLLAKHYALSVCESFSQCCLEINNERGGASNMVADENIQRLDVKARMETLPQRARLFISQS